MSLSTYDNKRGYSVRAAQGRIARAIPPSATVSVLVNSVAEIPVARRVFARQGPLEFVVAPATEIWTRDFGPIFTINPDRTKNIVDFRFNYWGYGRLGDELSDPQDRTELVIGKAQGLPPLRSPLISEGGNREFNGRGTMLVVESVERHRNPGWTLAEMETEFRRTLGVTNVIWLGEGGAEDDLTFNGPLPGNIYTVITTGGHVDNIARFADARTILLAEVTAEEASRSPIAAISRARLEANYRKLRAARDQNGQPFRILRMPSPDPMITTMSPGDGVYDFIKDLNYRRQPFPKGKPIKVIQAASYLNFLISNGTILTSRFYKPGLPDRVRQKDDESLRVLRLAFPGYRINAIDSEAINLGGGGIHCVTQQEPR